MSRHLRHPAAPCKTGDRVRLVATSDDQAPIPIGAEGYVLDVSPCFHGVQGFCIGVLWLRGPHVLQSRTQTVIWPNDQIEVVSPV